MRDGSVVEGKNMPAIDYHRWQKHKKFSLTGVLEGSK
jgi:hypothetical protein